MQLSLNWLKKFVDIPKGFSAEELGLKLTMSTVEVEGVQQQGELLKDVVVGKILELKKHPNADKLKLVIVDIGKDKFEAVCGGSNLKQGMLVAFAKVGAKVDWHGKGELEELKPIKIRGMESNGMICASYEIGIQHIIPCAGVEITDLSNLNLKVGTPLAEALNFNDTVFEIDNKSMTHRPDLWGVYGLARELAAVLKVKLKEYKTKEIKEGRGIKLKVEIKDKEKCQRYIGVVVDNIKIGPSPKWLARQLEAVGVQAINNIIDITNYVMLELGQPMHAFDLRQIEGNKIVVETAKPGEKFITLDDQERELDEEMLLIKDAKKAVALAGIMGGQNSEVKSDTTTILFESANFKAGNIRQTSMKLGLRSESSARFEKGLDPLLAEQAIKKAVALTLELIPEAKVASKLVDENFYEFKQLEIELDLDWLNRRIGIEIEKKEVIDILNRLQFEVKDKKDNLLVKIPSWRATGDVAIPEDLVEEIARLYGYDNIKPAMPMVSLGAPEVNIERQIERRVKNILAGSLGFSESYNYSFVNKNNIENFGFKIEDHIALKNYLSADQSLLRLSLIPNLTKNVVDNLRFYNNFKIFEVGRVFFKKDGDYIKRLGSDDRLPWQHKYLSGAIVEENNSEPFFVVKGVIENLLGQLDVDYYWQAAENISVWAEPARILEVVVRGKPLGAVSELKRTTAVKMDIGPAVGLFELDFTELAKLVEGRKKYQALSKYPPVLRDLSILVDQKISWEKIQKAVKKAGGELVEKIELFDVYQNGKIETGKRSLAFHLVYYSPERTLAATEVDKLQEKIIKELERKFGAKIR